MAAPIAVIGAGIIGCAITWALCREERRVLLLDRSVPATAGASYGNVGHIATEQVEPLPSPRLLLNFWRQLYAFGGPLDIPARRIGALAPWIAGFAAAAFRQKLHARSLAPLVMGAADSLDQLLTEIGRRDLLRRQGHYAVWLGPRAQLKAAAESHKMASLEVRTEAAPRDLVEQIAAAAGLRPARGQPGGAGVWFPDTAHVIDPAEVARSLAAAATQRGARYRRAEIRGVRPLGDRIEIQMDTGRLTVQTAVICAGAWSPPLLAPFGLKAPLEAERGYHVELPGHAPFVDAPLVYADHSVVVTPMAGRLRATSFLELAGLGAPPDPRKPARLRKGLRGLGYACPLRGPSWMGPRPTLPDYLPGIGRARGYPNLLYAVGHQHLGLTLAAPTAELIAALIAGRVPPVDTAAFDLARFRDP
jgi:D-amino-acid dehydrogenase